MCLFGYFIYDDCRHKGIEVVSHCVERLWKAGIDGQLWACPELHYIKHLTELSPLTWEGKHGYCKHCQQTYAMPETVSFRSFNDLYLPAERPDPIPPALDPYIYTPFVTKTVSELLGIESQIPAQEIRDGYRIKFPSNLDVYDRTEAGGNFQWISQGWYAGRRVGPVVSRFSFKAGMTYRDQRLVSEAIVQERVLGVWREEFERRGMPWGMFLDQARIIGESMGVRTLASNVWEDVTLSRFVEEKDFSGNMKED